MIRRLLWGAAVGLALVALVLLWATQSRSGLHGLVAVSSKLGGVSISHQQLEGKLSDIRARQLQISVGGMRFIAEDLKLQWRPLSLLGRQLRIDRLDTSLVDGQVETESNAASSPGSDQFDLPRLPIGIQADKVLIGQLVWQGKPALSAIDARVELRDQGWHFVVSSATFDQGSATAAVDILPGSLAHTITVNMTIDQYGEFKISLAGDRHQTVAKLTEANSATELAATIEAWTHSPVWEGTLTSDSLAPFGLPPGPISIQAQGSVDRASVSGQADLQGKVIELAPLNVGFGTLPASIDGQVVIDQWPLKIAATLDRDLVHNATIMLDQPTSLSDRSRLALQTAVIQADGPWADLALSARIQGTAADQPVTLDLVASLSQFVQLAVSRLEAELYGGKLGGSGQFDIQSMLGSASLSLSNIDLTNLDLRLPAAVGVNLELETQSATDGSLEFNQLSAVSAGRSIQGLGYLRWGNRKITEAAVDLSSANEKLLTAKLIDPGTQTFRLEAAVEDIAVLLPGASGSVMGKAEVSFANWSVDGDLRLSHLAVGDIALGSGRITGQGIGVDQTVQLKAADLRVQERQIDMISAEFAGTPANPSATSGFEQEQPQT